MTIKKHGGIFGRKPAFNSIELPASGGTGTATSNVLDFYEEGTFTATLTASSAAPTSSVTTTAYYTKIGNIVTVFVNFSNVDTSGASGTAEVTGLPFTPAQKATGSVTSFGALDVATVDTNGEGMAVVFETTGKARFFSLHDSANWRNVGIVAGSGKYLTFSGTYMV